MCIELFLCLLLAHLVADFALQTSKSCKHKREYKWRSGCHYGKNRICAGWDIDEHLHRSAGGADGDGV